MFFRQGLSRTGPDFGSKEIVAWVVSAHPDLIQQEEMLSMLAPVKPEGANLILHSDMGW